MRDGFFGVVGDDDRDGEVLERGDDDGDNFEGDANGGEEEDAGDEAEGRAAAATSAADVPTAVLVVRSFRGAGDTDGGDTGNDTPHKAP